MGLGFTEILILVVIAFLVFGPHQFPHVARNFIKIFNELKRAWMEVKSEFDQAETEGKKQAQLIAQDLQAEWKSIEEEIERAGEPEEKPSPLKETQESKENQAKPPTGQQPPPLKEKSENKENQVPPLKEKPEDKENDSSPKPEK